jgi:tyrosinase
MPNYGNTNSTAAADPMADNYRCLRRDLNTAVLARYSNFYNSTTLVLNSQDVGHFQGMMQGDPRLVTGELGVHGGGHFTIGGDPGSDPFISPGDPAFWLHHGQVDRLYWIWQNLDWADRQVGIFARPSSPLSVTKISRLTGDTTERHGHVCLHGSLSFNQRHR